MSPAQPTMEAFLSSLRPIDLQCAICIEPVGTEDRGPIVSPCGHVFCIGCIQTWVTSVNRSRNKCPTCRRLLFEDIARTSEAQPSNNEIEVVADNFPNPQMDMENADRFTQLAWKDFRDFYNSSGADLGDANLCLNLWRAVLEAGLVHWYGTERTFTPRLQNNFRVALENFVARKHRANSRFGFYLPSQQGSADTQDMRSENNRLLGRPLKQLATTIIRVAAILPLSPTKEFAHLIDGCNSQLRNYEEVIGFQTINEAVLRLDIASLPILHIFTMFLADYSVDQTCNGILGQVWASGPRPSDIFLAVAEAVKVGLTQQWDIQLASIRSLMASDDLIQSLWQDARTSLG